MPNDFISILRICKLHFVFKPEITGKGVKEHPVSYVILFPAIISVIFQNLDPDIINLNSLINGRIPFYKSFLVRICGMGRIRHPVHFLIFLLPNLFHISDKKLFRRLPSAAPHEINNPADCCKCCGYRQDSRSDVDTLFIPFARLPPFPFHICLHPHENIPPVRLDTRELSIAHPFVKTVLPHACICRYSTFYSIYLTPVIFMCQENQNSLFVQWDFFASIISILSWNLNLPSSVDPMTVRI